MLSGEIFIIFFVFLIFFCKKHCADLDFNLRGQLYGSPASAWAGKYARNPIRNIGKIWHNICLNVTGQHLLRAHFFLFLKKYASFWQPISSWIHKITGSFENDDFMTKTGYHTKSEYSLTFVFTHIFVCLITVLVFYT